MNILLDTKGREFWLNENGIVYDNESFLNEKDNESSILTAMAFIKFSCKKLTGANKSISSYGLKHDAEKWGDRFNKFLKKDIFSSYISNGVFILAAKKCGLKIYPIKGTYNCFLNIRTI